MSIVAELYTLVNVEKIPLAQAVEQIVPGADLAYWQKRLATYNPNACPSKRRKKQTRNTRRIQRTTFRADAVLARSSYASQQSGQNQASSQLVERVNEEPTEPEARQIPWFVNGHTRILEVV